MTVTFLRQARSSAAKRPSRRRRPGGRETLVEAGRERGAARGVVATRVIFARRAGSSHALIAAPTSQRRHLTQSGNFETPRPRPERPPGLAPPENHQHPVMAAHLDRSDRGIR